MGKKLRVAVLFGGKSGEHEVSVQSAASVLKAIDRNRFDVIPIAIDKSGEWRIGQKALPYLEKKGEPALLESLKSRLPDVSVQGEGMVPALDWDAVDVVFPVLHGTYGEDGTIQGFFELANIPYVGAGVLASAVGMDKVIMKKIFAQEGLPQGRFSHVLRSRLEREMDRVIEEIEAAFDYPVFLKPANLGSSVGISKATNREELIKGLRLAAQYDRKVVVEEFIPAREVEVAVLGNDDPQASVPGEIISSNDFYDYRAKYIDGKSEMRIPADLPAETAEKIRQLAVKAYRAIDCSGLARVDFFVRKDNGQVLINEINTLPGFTQYSMYPKLWEHSGLSYTDLITKLIELAMERHREKEKTVTTLKLDEAK
ncbi:D-alanine--D-alanine ligase [Polycladomyces sp. WAk]|uniref:D-alanine--D-alanine ligase n=1 Tax=Polycladomyces zharkentensis TaxID=2807616 RepID=A0ABS2WKX5_9BACL|nr:D-alanine--D-alanine ligase [Polycladomyces sp. WAk]MBN2910217.1 D-alanine--D-alanine ligase [Polycladomyces sp. WAk]